MIDKNEVRKKNLSKRIKNEVEIHIHLCKQQYKSEFQPILTLYHVFEDDANIYLLME